MAFTELPPLRICLLAPRDHPLAGRKWSWQDLARQPLAVLEGDGQLSRFLAEQERATGIRLDVAVGCSTWTQVIDVMREFKLAGILPHDLAKQGPPEYVRVEIGELAAYADRYVIAWPEAEAARREEIARVAESLLGKKRGAG
jgi:DNA-binding transcriptional LysR family regulator